jgi:putative Mg2+ transporter-C (MgtC) family protein
VTALVLGAVIGLERQWRQRMAGLRTNTLVATGAALFVTLTTLIGQPNANPTAVPAQIASGIGFLAGAIIFREGLTFTGLNTAATLWGTAAVGSLAGAGRLIEAAIGTLGILCANVVLRPIARRLNRRPLEEASISATYEVRVVTKSANEGIARAFVLNTIQGFPSMLHSIASRDLSDTGDVEVEAIVTSPKRDDETLEKIVARLSLDPAISAAGWRVGELPAPPRDAEEG